MEEAYKNGSDDIVPNVVSYTALMAGWMKSSDPNKTEKVREIFERMQKMHENGNDEAQPNIFSYVTLFDSIVKSKKCDAEAAEYAEKLVRGMYDDYRRGVSSVKPNAQAVTTVINCWTNSWDRESGERAEALLNWLIEIYEQDRDKSLQPTEYAFATGKNTRTLVRELLGP
jgi:hypothetical protein